MIVPTLAVSAHLLVVAISAPPADTAAWGKFIDPDGDCTARFGEDSVTIEVPESHHDLSIEIGADNAPRVLTDIDGDFIVQVRVEGAIRPTGPSTVPGRTPYHGAGLLFRLDDATYVRLERAALVEPQTGEVRFYAGLEVREGAVLTGAQGAATADEPLHLRLERRGGRVVGSISRDGLNWRAFEPIPADLSGPAEVGVAVITSASNPLRAEFEEFSLYSRQNLASP